MTAILSAIYCFLVGMIASFYDLVLSHFDSLLGVLDTTLASINIDVLEPGSIPSEYAWVLGATGMSQAIAIVAGAMLIRFLLQTVPFVRWGS